MYCYLFGIVRLRCHNYIVISIKESTLKDTLFIFCVKKLPASDFSPVKTTIYFFLNVNSEIFRLLAISDYHQYSRKNDHQRIITAFCLKRNGDPRAL